MTQSFGMFSVPDAGKTWNVRGSGASLWNFDNHVVKVQGLADPKAASPVLYAQSIQDTGQPCGSAATATTTAPNATAPASTTVATAQTTPGTPEPRQQPGGAVAQNSVPAGQANPQTSAAQAGTTGVTTPVPQTTENKGTPAAASPTGGAIASDSSASSGGASPNSAAPASNNAAFSGCLLGSVNDYQFKANGKTYRLQGDTTQLNSMFKHNVEITGEDFNGKAIEVNGARDLGTSCK
jgi:hypothetical protein